jgi:hypothetical protein
VLADFNPEEREKIHRVQPWVDQASAQYTLERSLINAVIWVESRFEPRAKSPAGARGLMQLMPATASALARKMGRTRAASYDPEFNIMAGSRYLHDLRDRYDGDVRLALAAYNAGAGNVDKWMAADGLPPRSEHYVQLVLDAKARFEAVRNAPAETPRDTMIANAPRPAPAERPTSEMEAPPPTPAPAPAPAPQPREVVPEPPVRYDLDRVESDYEPHPDPEPPLTETPAPPRDRARAVAPPSTPDAPDPPPEDGLPSVLD